MNTTWLITGGRIVDPATNRDEVADLYVHNGVITPLPATLPPDTPRIPASGKIVAPGLMDLHVHFREPGGEAAETIASGSRAAARGGFTTVVTMPNTHPPVDTPERVAYQLEQGRTTGLATVLPSACLTQGRAGTEPVSAEALAEAGAVALTDDGATVADNNVMQAIMSHARAAGLLVMDHALDPTLTGNGVMHEGTAATALGLPGIPARAETAIVQRDIALAETTGCLLHIQHTSCSATVDMIRSARKRGLPVSGEVTPHHLALTDAVVQTNNTAFKMSPPLRTEEDRLALIEGLADGTLQALATDHAPHTAAAKAAPFTTAPFGVVGLETAVGVTYEHLVRSGPLSVLQWLELWTTGPAAILRRTPPSLSPNAPADLTILDLDTQWTVHTDQFASGSSNTPFAGHTLTGHAVCTLREGRITWKIPATPFTEMHVRGSGTE